MIEGLEFTIRFLEKTAARHQFYADKESDGHTVNERLAQKEACLGAVKTLKKRLRSAKKESGEQADNKQSMPHVCCSRITCSKFDPA